MKSEIFSSLAMILAIFLLTAIIGGINSCREENRAERRMRELQLEQQLQYRGS